MRSPIRRSRRCIRNYNLTAGDDILKNRVADMFSRLIERVSIIVAASPKIECPLIIYKTEIPVFGTHEIEAIFMARSRSGSNTLFCANYWPRSTNFSKISRSVASPSNRNPTLPQFYRLLCCIHFPICAGWGYFTKRSCGRFHHRVVWMLAMTRVSRRFPALVQYVLGVVPSRPSLGILPPARHCLPPRVVADPAR